jgi:hypothetical protein
MKTEDGGLDPVDRCGVHPFATTNKDEFHDQCVGHDDAYRHGGTTEQLIATDNHFYNQIWRKAMRKPWLVPKALVYTLACSFVGRWIWKREK